MQHHRITHNGSTFTAHIERLVVRRALWPAVRELTAYVLIAAMLVAIVLSALTIL